MSNRIQAETGE